MERVDAVVVGSGFGGTIPALRLAEAGAKVVVLERGRRASARDFRQSWDPRYLLGILKAQPTDDYNVLFRYGRVVGGGSVLFSGAMLRAPSEVFDFALPDGRRAWPDGITRKALDPHYETVERMMSVRQARWDEVPRTGAVFAMMLANMGLDCDRGRFPYVDCLQCGFCEAGCPFDRKRSLILNYIPAAEKLGAEFRAEAEVGRVEPSDGGYLVRYREPSGAEREIWGRRAIVAANAIETPAVLLRSADALPKLSPVVGQNLNNNGDVAWYFMLPEGRFPDYAHWKGRNNAVMITYAFWDEHRISIHTGCPPPGVIAALDLRREAQGSLAWGIEHKRLMHAVYRNRMVGALAIGLVPGGGSVRVDAGGQLMVTFRMTPDLEAHTARVMGVARAIADANGAEVLRTAREGVPHGDAHPLGTCRMGDEPATSVVDPDGEIHGYPGLYVSDGSTLCGGTGVNPSLTIAANAERIAARIVGDL